MNYKKGLERNLWLYALMMVFRKKAYVPVLVIYATAYVGLSVEQFGVIIAIASLVAMVVEVPSGYISDKIGHKTAIILGSSLIMIGPLGFVIYQNFYSILFAVVIPYLGYAFYSGTKQAFLHETLIELGRDNEFGEISARAQRWGLFGNIFIVALVPLTYSTDPRLPFLIGFALQSMLLWISLALTTPHNVKQKSHEKIHDGFFALLKTVRLRGEILLFFFLGVVASLYSQIPQYKELYFQDVGVPLWFFGFVYSITSIVGIVFTYYVHKLEKSDAVRFYLIDFLAVTTASILVGFVSNAFFGVLIFILWGGYWRIRGILVHSYILRACPTKNFKATYLSMYSFLSRLNSIWVPAVLGYLIGHFGVQVGYSYFGFAALIVLAVMYLLIFVIFRKGRNFA